MVIMNPIMCQAVLEGEGSMGNNANNKNNNNNKKSVSPSPLKSCPLGRRTHCQRQCLIAPGVCQACSHLKAIVSAAPSARNMSPHGQLSEVTSSKKPSLTTQCEAAPASHYRSCFLV